MKKEIGTRNPFSKHQMILRGIGEGILEGRRYSKFLCWGGGRNGRGGQWVIGKFSENSKK